MSNVYWGAPEAMAAGADPFALLLGDSWFWYPLSNLAVEIGAAMPDEEFVVAGANGANAGDWATKLRRSSDFTFRMYAAGVKALILSGGGNEIAGEEDFLAILAEPEQCRNATKLEQCYEAGQPDGVMERIAAAYRAVILKFRAYNRSATVFTHNYDHCWPTGKGLFGPGDWLKRPMELAEVPANLRRDLFKDLLRRLNVIQNELALEPALAPLIPIVTAGTLPDKKSVWANEIHPTPAGFKLIARKAIAPALKTWKAALAVKKKRKKKRG